ncbi:MAG: NfeD family protein [Acidobacteriota bacterium]
MRKPFLGICLVLAVLAGASARGQGVFRIQMDQPIQPIVQEYVVNAIREANDKGASLILLEIDTPGGYVSSVEQIQKAILSSRAPVVAYVAPAGARAASGGAYVAMACDLIAMAPGTNIGAAHPVSGVPIPVPTPPQPPTPQSPEKGPQPAPPAQEGGVEMQKVVNDLAAHMRSLAENRHRNVAIAEQMVRESISLSEQEALRDGLIELIAQNEGDIFSYVREHPIRRFNGVEQKVDLPPSPVVTPIDMTARERFLSALANPSLAYLLLLLGILGLFVEFKSPGLIFPGVMGGLFILLYVMSIPLLPINVVGLLLIILGLVFFILEIKVVSYGILAVGGVISLFIGSLLLYSGGPIPELRLSLTLVVPVVLAFSAIVVFLLVLVARAFRNPVVTGEQGMMGQEGEVREAIHPPEPGKVFVFGEYWNAVSDQPFEVGAAVKVVGRDGMTLRVAPLSGGGKDAAG